MPLGTAVTHGANEFFTHYTGVRLRVVGSGNLQLQFNSYDNVYSQDIGSVTLLENNRVSIFCLANIIEQRVQLEGKTTEENDFMRVHRIILYARPIATMEPG